MQSAADMSSKEPVPPTSAGNGAQGWAIARAMTHDNSKRWLLPVLAIPLLAIPALYTFLAYGLPHSFDGGLHLLRIAALDRHLRSGVLLPRWMPEMLSGYGYPLLNYYAPASYYITESFHLLGMSIYNATIATYALYVLLAGFGMHLLARDFFDGKSLPALVAAAAYLLAPYLLINLYNRGAIAEAGAQALLPWLLWCAGRIFRARNPAPAAVGMAFVLALLATMHTLSLLFIPPLLAIYLVFGWRDLRQREPAAAWSRAGLAIGALLAAMAMSAFFWLPLLLERQFLGETAFDIARGVWLPQSVWTWSNFLDTGFVFENSSIRPVRLGIVQIVLAAGGLLVGAWLGRRRDWQWLFWFGVALLCVLLVSSWSMFLWENTLLVAAQFPWRLLSILTLPLALFSGGLLLWTHNGWLQLATCVVALTVIVAAHTPHLADADYYSAETASLDQPVLAMIDMSKGVVTGGEFNSSVQEFRPRWSATNLTLDTASVEAPARAQASALETVLLSANAYDLGLRASTPITVPLRFSAFYFPGWQVALAGGAALEPYPSTNQGLLTVDVPPGTHEVHVSWQGTALQRLANSISLAALVAIGVLLLLRRGVRWLAAPALVFALIGGIGLLWSRSDTAVQQPMAAVEAHGVRLLGATFTTGFSGGLLVRPWWQVLDAPPAGLRFHWQVQDSAGNARNAAAMRPWFNASSAADWPMATIVDDGQQVPLPAGLPAGTYTLALALTLEDEDPQDYIPVFDFTIDADVASDPTPAHALDARIGEHVTLEGYAAVAANQRANLHAVDASPLVVRAGEMVEYMLYWTTAAVLERNLHGFVHLLDVNGLPLAQRDQAPGPLYTSTEIWQPGRTNLDIYRLRIPEWTESGIYTPIANLYDFESLERLPVWMPGSDTPAADVRLAPLKVLNPPTRAHGEALNLALGDFATLAAWRAHNQGVTVQRGDEFTVTLTFRSEAVTTGNFTRFLQLVSDDGTIAAQQDGIPQRAFNPTWSWVPGELIVDEVVLPVRADAPPGAYRLLAGLYDAAAGTRVPAVTQDGTRLADDAITLAVIEVLP